MTPEVLQTGLLVFALGMGMVFAVLFVIFVVLKIMGFVAVSLTKKTKPAPAPAAAPVPVAAAPAPASNDNEIAAVISAAIAAYCAGEPGVNPSRLKIRSIRRTTKWDGSK